MTYWGNNAAYGGTELLPRLRAAAERRRDVLLGQMPALAKNPVTHRLMSDYAQAVQVALKRIASKRVGVSPTDLCFHYIHMTNNRLGILPLEESYLACFMLSNHPVAQ